MFFNYLKTAFRNLTRHKAYAIINIAGLAVGIAACLILSLIVLNERSYDKSQPNFKRIHRIVSETRRPDGVQYTPGVPFPALEAVRNQFPQATTAAIFSDYECQVTIPGKDDPSGKKFIEDYVFFTEPEWFQAFQYKWLAGSPSLLKAPNTVILTRKMAEKYFGNWQTAVGKLIKIENAVDLQVVGVIENPPVNTDFPLEIVGSFATVKSNAEKFNYSDSWNSTTSGFQLYMLLPSQENPQKVSAQLFNEFSKKYYKNDGASKTHSFLQPLSELHFDRRFESFGHTATPGTLLTISLIGVFILVMACINFINLSTAQAVKRSKEVGIRKVMGSNRTNLFFQFMGETAIIVFAALLIALVITFLCLPLANKIIPFDQKLNILTANNLMLSATLGILVTIGAGFYPSLVMSGFNPMLALKNKISSANIGGVSLRRGLVVLQFCISQIFIIGTIIAITQMNYVHNADLGFNKEAVLLLNSSRDSIIQSRYAGFKRDLLAIPGVQSVSFSSDVPSSQNTWSRNFSFDHRADETFPIYIKLGDEDYFKTFGIHFIAGHSYSKSDTTKDVVVNETLLKKLGIKDPALAIGKEIRLGSENNPWREIVGVVKDFKTTSLRDETQPLLLAAGKSYYSITSVRIRSNNLSHTKELIEKAWNKTNPEYAFVSGFMDELIERFYRQEDMLSLMFKVFAGIAIFISCLGLYGLVSFMAVQRTKEVGIRKVLGASIGHIIYLFSREFILLIGIAFLIAGPLAAFIMNHWLANFAYRVSLSYGFFILAIAISVGIALVTVAYKSLKAATASPINSLRSE